jgi:hypothetical protein
MWCVPKLTREYIDRMENILELYAKSYNPREPVLCLDEKSKQLIQDTRAVKNTREGKPRKRDYEYKRNGTRNLFVTVEPKGGHREVEVTKHRKKPDFAREIKRISTLPYYRNADKIHFVLDNLNTHFEKSIIETFGKQKAARLMKRIQFHYTPKHASWLNMAEIEIGVLSRQCIKGRIPTEEKITRHIKVWKNERNRQKALINWQFTVKDARQKFRYTGAELN